MKMRELEKLFVNNNNHSQRVSSQAEQLLGYINLEPSLKYLDVGTGNGAAPIYMAQKYGLHVTGVDIDPEQIKIAENNSIGIPRTRFLTVGLQRFNARKILHTINLRTIFAEKFSPQV